MGWNEPDKDKDPWGGKNEPPDLDEALKRLQMKLKNIVMQTRGLKAFLYPGPKKLAA